MRSPPAPATPPGILRIQRVAPSPPPRVVADTGLSCRIGNRSGVIARRWGPGARPPSAEPRPAMGGQTPFLLRGLHNACGSAADDRAAPATPGASRSGQMLTLPDTILAGLLGTEHNSSRVVHYVSLQAVKSAVAAHRRGLGTPRGERAYAALTEAQRHRLSEAGARLRRDWSAFKATLVEQAVDALPADCSDGERRSCREQASACAGYPPAQLPGVRFFRAPLQRAGALAPMKPAIMAWLTLHVQAVQNLDRRPANGAGGPANDAQVYLADMERVLEGPFREALEEASLYRIFNALHRLDIEPR